MIRKQIYITQEIDRKVKMLSGLKGIDNESEVIRTALDHYFSQTLTPQTAWYKITENGSYHFSHMESGHSTKKPTEPNTWAKIHGYMIGKDFYDTHGNHFKLCYQTEPNQLLEAVL